MIILLNCLLLIYSSSNLNNLWFMQLEGEDLDAVKDVNWGELLMYLSEESGHTALYPTASTTSSVISLYHTAVWLRSNCSLSLVSWWERRRGDNWKLIEFMWCLLTVVWLSEQCRFISFWRLTSRENSRALTLWLIFSCSALSRASLLICWCFSNHYKWYTFASMPRPSLTWLRSPQLYFN